MIQRIRLTGFFLFLSLGVLAGDDSIRFRMGLGAGLSYSDNPYSLIDSQRTGKSVADMSALIRPQLSLMTKGNKLDLNVGGDGALNVLFGLNNQKASVFFTGGVNGSAVYNSEGDVSLATTGGFNASRNVGELFIGDVTTLAGNAGLGTSIRPGGGKFGFSLGGNYTIQGYQGITIQDKTSIPNSLDNQTYAVNGRIFWNFMPKMSAYAVGSYGFFVNDDLSAVKGKSNPMSAGVGVNGEISSALSAGLDVRFSRVFLKINDANVDSTSFPIGATAHVAWMFGPRSNIAFSLSRELVPSPIFLDQASNTASIVYNQAFLRGFLFSLNPSAGLIEFGKPDSGLSTTNYRVGGNYKNRNDIYAGVGTGLSYSFTDWFSLGLSGNSSWRFTTTDPAQALSTQGWVAQADGSKYNKLFSRYQGNVFVNLIY